MEEVDASRRSARSPPERGTDQTNGAR
jgi:hypothetical protein